MTETVAHSYSSKSTQRERERWKCFINPFMSGDLSKCSLHLGTYENNFSLVSDLKNSSRGNVV